MRKLTRRGFNLLFIIITLMLFLWGGSIIFRDIAKSNKLDQDILILDSDRGILVDMEPEEEILVEIMSRDYRADFSMQYHEYLLKISIDGKQVGVVYFDENGEIRFDGDKERFEYGLYRAFKLREESWGYRKEKK